ncbi:DNA repair protein RecO [Pontibacterium granulatum]|uniref:DNA repair protein RecO n=1 Tax=Pontibacterium granulatum TaxID=2036029 RepID=UPI00249B0A8F|nr:DNA repair protein RecO [Pontibacterium granulatum]MDI3323109.1 DNA repair protein RecO [Pontibacterium granulatum]
MEYVVDGQAAYVLHGRPYRDTSLLVDFFTLEHGKVSAVVRGAKRPNSKLRPVIQPFLPLQIGWRGRQELKNLTLAEPVDANPFLSGNALMCGLYVNELLERLLQPLDPHPHLYVYYQYVVNELRSGEDIEGALRTFERRLMMELGHAPDLTDLEPDGIYVYDPGQGVQRIAQPTDQNRMRCFYGRHLQAIEQDSYDQRAVRQAAKRLMRLLIDQLLGDKPLRSRELFQKR